MAKIKFFLAIILGVIAIGLFSSCEKDEPKPEATEWDNLLISISNDMESYNQWLSEQLFQQVNDTIWPLGPDGLPVKERHPETGEWIINGVNAVYNDFANAKRMSENNANEKMGLLAQKLWEWQDANPNKRGMFSSWDYEDCFIVIETIDGKSLQEDATILNELGKLAIQYPNKPPITIIRDECIKLIPKTKKASIVHLEKVIIEGGK